MKTFLERNKKQISKISEFLAWHRWLILSLIGASLLWVEIEEFVVLRVLNQPFHYFEVFQYAVLLTSTGMLVELYARSNRAHRQAVSILKYKHQLSLEFASTEKWDALIHSLVELPTKITDDVEESYLLMGNPVSGNFMVAEHWAADECVSKSSWDPMIPCPKCLETVPSARPTFHLCNYSDEDSSQQMYSLAVLNPDLPATVLRFKLKPNQKLSDHEDRIFESILDEVLVALQTSQARKRLSEIQSAEVAMTERRLISSYVHDHLGQNLGYMHFKLDQLGANENVVNPKDLRNDLKNLQEVANESYEIVRDILKKMQPETIPNLTSLMKEQAMMISRRVGFSLNFESVGTPIFLTPAIQQTIFFVFREILGNVEKHAHASKVDVLVVWNDNFLDVSVSDNGKGFNPQLVQSNEHFGLGIMQERIANIKGKLMLSSSINSGTTVSISLPLESLKMEEAHE